ncbi:MAG: tetratricopeptide repeat protein [Bacteroidia bacterium]|nr:tetratricopeptide repeat protein [Bacteroidia bacterium]
MKFRLITTLKICILILIYSISAAQKKSETDSLLKKIDKCKGTEKISLLQKLSELTLTQNPGKSYEYITDAIALSRELDEKEKTVQSFILLGRLYQTQGKYSKAIRTFMIAQSMYENIANPEGMAVTFNHIGIVYYYQGKYDLALESYQKSLKIYEKIKNDEKTVKSLNNIGVVYDELKNYDKAMEYYHSALKINQKLNDKKGIAVSLNNIGNCYYYNGDFEKAIEHFKKSIDLKKESGDVKGLANSYFNLARIYFDNEDYRPALDLFEKCRTIEEKNHFLEGLTNTYLYIGQTYDKLNNSPDALAYYYKSLAIADSLKLLPAQKNCYYALSEICNNMKKYELAFDYYREYTRCKEELFNEDMHKQISEIESKSQIERKEQEIELYSSEIKWQRLLITFAAIGILILVIFLISLFIQIRQKKKVNHKLKLFNKEIEKQKFEITSSIEYARRIQAAILPEDAYIQKLLPEYFIYYRPKDIVSGDFYWIDEVNNAIYIAVVDCTGHGVPGAFMSLVGNILLNEIIYEKKLRQPAGILNELNHLVKASLRQDEQKIDNLDGMDISLCAICKTDNKIYFSGANRDLYLIRNDTLLITEADNSAIGGVTPDHYSFKNHELELQKNDVIYLFTDGFTDQFGGEKGKKFLVKNFKDTLLKIHKLPMPEQKEELIRIFKNWRNERPQLDDILIAGIRIV